MGVFDLDFIGPFQNTVFRILTAFSIFTSFSTPATCAEYDLAYTDLYSPAPTLQQFTAFEGMIPRMPSQIFFKQFEGIDFPAQTADDPQEGEQPSQWTQISVSIFELDNATHFARTVLTEFDADPRPSPPNTPDHGFMPIKTFTSYVAHTAQPVLDTSFQFEVSANVFCSCFDSSAVEMDGFAVWRIGQDNIHVSLAEYQQNTLIPPAFIDIFADVTSQHTSAFIIATSEAKLTHSADLEPIFKGNLYLGRSIDAPFQDINAIFVGTDFHQRGHDVLAIDITSSK